MPRPHAAPRTFAAGSALPAPLIPAPSKTYDENVPFDTAVFPISKNQVEALKGAAGAASAGTGKKVSTYSAVVAHVWQCSCKAKGLSGTAEDSQIYGVGCLRLRMCPPLPRVFFGNTIAIRPYYVNDGHQGEGHRLEPS